MAIELLCTHELNNYPRTTEGRTMFVWVDCIMWSIAQLDATRMDYVVEHCWGDESNFASITFNGSIVCGELEASRSYGVFTAPIPWHKADAVVVTICNEVLYLYKIGR